MVDALEYISKEYLGTLPCNLEPQLDEDNIWPGFLV